MAKLPQDLANTFSNLEAESGWQTPGTLKGLAQIESSNNPNAKAEGSTAEGMFQIVKGTRKMLGLENPFDPVASAQAAMKYLNQLKKMFNGDEQKAVLAYHAGPGNVMKYGLDTSQMPKAVVRNYLDKFNKAVGNPQPNSIQSYSQENTYSSPSTQTAGETQSFNNNADYKSGYNLAVPQTLDAPESSITPATQVPGSFSNNQQQQNQNNYTNSIASSNNSGYNLGIPQTLEGGTTNVDGNGNSSTVNNTNNNVNLNANSNVSSNSNAQLSVPGSSWNQLNNSLNQAPTSTTLTTNPTQQAQQDLRNYDPQAVPGNPPRTLDQQLFDRFSSLPDDQQVNFYQNLDQGNKNLLLSAIQKNIGNNPEVDHPGVFRNFIQGALNRGNEMGRSLNALVARGISGGANAIGLESIGKGAENFANQISRDQLRYEAVKELNDAANPSLARGAGEIATDVGATLALPVAGATGNLAVKGAKYALSGAAYNTLTAPTRAFNNDDYFREKVKDAAMGGLFGVAGGLAGDKAAQYISRRFGDFIPTKSKELQDWAKRNGINMSAFAFPEVRKELTNFLTANGRDPKVAKIIEDAGDEIVSYNKKFGNQFGDYFTDSTGAVTTPANYVKDNFPQVYQRLDEFNNGANSTVPYGTTIDKLMKKLAAPKSTEDVFSSLAQLNMLNRRIISNDLYSKAEQPLSKFQFSSDELKDKLQSALKFNADNGNSATRSTINKILSELPDGESVSALKIENINKLFGEISNSEAVRGSTAQPLYVKASNELDNYLQNAAVNNDKFANVWSKYNDAKLYNKNAIQEVQQDALSHQVFNQDLDKIEKVTKSSDMSALNNIWTNMDTASQKSLQNYVMSSITAKSSTSGELNPMVYAKNIDKLLESKMGQVVFKAHKEDLQNIADLSRNINLGVTKAVQNGSLARDAMSRLKEIAGTSANLALIGGPTAMALGLGAPAALSVAAASIALPMFLRNNTTKILGSKELRNELFELTQLTKTGEFTGEMLANFMRNVSNAGESNLNSPSAGTANEDLLELQNLARQRSQLNNQNGVEFNATNPNNNTSNNEAGANELQALINSRGIK